MYIYPLSPGNYMGWRIITSLRIPLLTGNANYRRLFLLLMCSTLQAFFNKSPPRLPRRPGSLCGRYCSHCSAQPKGPCHKSGYAPQCCAWPAEGPHRASADVHKHCHWGTPYGYPNRDYDGMLMPGYACNSLSNGYSWYTGTCGMVHFF